LLAWESTDLLEYETCEQRVPGNFDDRLEGQSGRLKPSGE
jgi:hypothetical protein